MDAIQLRLSDQYTIINGCIFTPLVYSIVNFTLSPSSVAGCCSGPSRVGVVLRRGGPQQGLHCDETESQGGFYRLKLRPVHVAPASAKISHPGDPTEFEQSLWGVVVNGTRPPAGRSLQPAAVRALVPAIVQTSLLPPLLPSSSRALPHCF
ncbi:hypothetical protein SRHO_G00027280 [Serrasalmus rhombeus]